MNMHKNGCRALVWTAVVIFTFGVQVGVARGQEKTAETKKGKAEVLIEEIIVEPSAPAADTLCRLRVKLRNNGKKTATLFAFEVKVGGQVLPVYGKELFALPVAAGTSAELRLFNFWTTETGRTLPKGGKLTVEVRLLEAQWADISTNGQEEIWSTLGPVQGLPVEKSVTLAMKKGS